MNRRDREPNSRLSALLPFIGSGSAFVIIIVAFLILGGGAVVMMMMK